MSVRSSSKLKPVNNFRAIKSLFRQLESYGLNPREWRIERNSLRNRLDKIEMRHRHDHEFRFQGRLDRSREGRTIIAQMTLISV